MMPWRRGSAALAAVVATIAITAAQQDTPDAQDPPVFRARATAVSLDVSVKRGSRPVTGLTAADFEVTDNGVPQTVEQAFTDTVPIDVTLLVDAGAATHTVFTDIWRNTQRILGLLRPDDRGRVVIIETTPYELLPLQRVDRGIVLPAEQPPGPYSSIHDAILVGLVTRPDPDRRRLLVAITSGIDRKSVTSVQSLEAVARRSETVLHLISVVPESGGSESPRRVGRSWHAGFVRDQPTTQEMDLFERLPAITGGAFHGPSYNSRRGGNINAVARIRDVIDEFRQSYVIQYTPRDVGPGGWHDVVVRVRGVNANGVRTRAGYFDAAP